MQLQAGAGSSVKSKAPAIECTPLVENAVAHLHSAPEELPVKRKPGRPRKNPVTATLPKSTRGLSVLKNVSSTSRKLPAEKIAVTTDTQKFLPSSMQAPLEKSLTRIGKKNCSQRKPKKKADKKFVPVSHYGPARQKAEKSKNKRVLADLREDVPDDEKSTEVEAAELSRQPPILTDSRWTQTTFHLRDEPINLQHHHLSTAAAHCSREQTFSHELTKQDLNQLRVIGGHSALHERCPAFSFETPRPLQHSTSLPCRTWKEMLDFQRRSLTESSKICVLKAVADKMPNCRSEYLGDKFPVKAVPVEAPLMSAVLPLTYQPTATTWQLRQELTLEPQLEINCNLILDGNVICHANSGPKILTHENPLEQFHPPRDSSPTEATSPKANLQMPPQPIILCENPGEAELLPLEAPKKRNSPKAELDPSLIGKAAADLGVPSSTAFQSLPCLGHPVRFVFTSSQPSGKSDAEFPVSRAPAPLFDCSLKAQPLRQQSPPLSLEEEASAKTQSKQLSLDLKHSSQVDPAVAAVSQPAAASSEVVPLEMPPPRTKRAYVRRKPIASAPLKAPKAAKRSEDMSDQTKVKHAILPASRSCSSTSLLLQENCQREVHKTKRLSRGLKSPDPEEEDFDCCRAVPHKKHFKAPLLAASLTSFSKQYLTSANFLSKKSGHKTVRWAFKTSNKQSVRINNFHAAWKQSILRLYRFVIRPSTISGHGVYTSEAIEDGELLMEYSGEIVRRPIADIREKEGRSKDIYFFALNQDFVIDATHSGSIARYINHSCSPNCVAKKVKAQGQLRIFVRAARSIAAGEEITYDYCLSGNEDKSPCVCRAENCRGFL